MTRHNHRHNSKKKPPAANVNIGTAMIQALVANSQTRDEDKVAINAMKDSVWHYMNSQHKQTDKVHWAAAGMLAAYNLGRWGTKIPPIKKKVETP
jgi:hypothetical protein